MTTQIAASSPFAQSRTAQGCFKCPSIVTDKSTQPDGPGNWVSCSSRRLLLRSGPAGTAAGAPTFADPRLRRAGLQLEGVLL